MQTLQPQQPRLPAKSDERPGRWLHPRSTAAKALARVTVVISLVVIATSCSIGPGSPSLVILISIDTLRADHLGCYGYERETSPNLDRLAAQSILFERAFSHASSTLPAHASLFSSLLPQHHGASHRHRRALPSEVTTVAEVLSDHGWETASFNGGGQLASDFGIAQGFGHYQSLRREEDRFTRIVQLGLEWLQRPAKRPRFLFLHSYEVHQPPSPPPELLELFARDPGGSESSESDRLRTVDQYDAEIRSMDRGIGLLEATLRERGLWHEALVILTSDHGEELGERGQLAQHSHSLYDELLHVPLLIKIPRATTGDRHTSPVRLIDVAPTLVSLAGIAPPPTFDGVDLLTSAGEVGPLIAYRDTATKTPVHALRTPRWKWIGGALFDLAHDPGESHDVAADNPAVKRDLERQMRRTLSSRAPFHSQPAHPSEATESQLRALGYVGAN